jgi:GntR family transcriptional regulator/MocR family aminotransferase
MKYEECFLASIDHPINDWYIPIMRFADLQVNRSLSVPLHEQIAGRLREWIANGTLPAGERLPASRDLASLLSVNRGTVQKAYDLLVSEKVARAHVGRGTFVTGEQEDGRSIPATDDSTRGRGAARGLDTLPFSFDLRAVEEPEWERLARWSTRPGVISLAGGVPDARLFPVEPFRECLNAALDEDGTALLQYGASRGYPSFLSFLSRHLHRRGLPVPPERILVVSGSQQGLDLIGRALISPGDTVVVEEPTYSGALALFRMLGARLLTVPVDEEGLDVEVLAGLLVRERPKLVYTIPTFHNPTGQTLSPARRGRLLEVCAAAGVPVVEDDSDGELRYDGEEQPPLAAWPAARGIIYMGTFSKLFFPGLRLGWVVADGPAIQRLEATKRVTDLHTPLLLQAAMARFAESDVFRNLAGEVRSRYRIRRDAMLEALTEGMPEGVSWTKPQGGLSLMVDLPPDMDAADLLVRAVEEGVVFAPGQLFAPGGGGVNRLRLTFGNVDEEEIREGIERLTRAVQAELKGSRHGGVRGGRVPAPPPV